MGDNIKLYKTIGLAYRANCTVLGFDEIIRNKEDVKLVIVASAASVNAQKRLRQKTIMKKIKFIYLAEDFADELSSAIGKRDIKILGITDNGFKKIMIAEASRG